MISILKKLNEDAERGVLIGRNALNFHHNPKGGNVLFATDDYDIVCPDVKAADECNAILNAAGFTKTQATFTREDLGQIDVIIADPQLPAESVVEDYFNLPVLRPLWDARENRGGVLVPSVESIVLNKLLYLRENQGRDTESIGIYFRLNPEKLDATLEAIASHENTDQRDRMLYALYAGVAKNNELRQKVEKALLSDLETQ